MTLLCFLTTSMTDIPTYVSLWKKRWIKKIPFLDVLINNSQHQSPITRVYRRKTFTGLLTNYFSFTPFSYKLGLIRTLVDRTYKINNTWVGVHEDIKKLILILRKNLFPVISLRGSSGSILQKLRPFRAYLLVLPLILHIFSNYLMLGPSLL